MPQLRVHMLCAVSSHSVVPNSATPWAVALQAVHWNSPGKNTGVGCHALLQGIFPPQGSNPCLLSASLALAGGFFTTWVGMPQLEDQRSPMPQLRPGVANKEIFFKKKKTSLLRLVPPTPQICQLLKGKEAFCSSKSWSQLYLTNKTLLFCMQENGTDMAL